MTFSSVWPPARARAPSFPARRATASSTVEGRAYATSRRSMSGFNPAPALTCQARGAVVGSTARGAASRVTRQTFRTTEATHMEPASGHRRGLRRARGCGVRRHGPRRDDGDDDRRPVRQPPARDDRRRGRRGGAPVLRRPLHREVAGGHRDHARVADGRRRSGRRRARALLHARHRDAAAAAGGRAEREGTCGSRSAWS